MTKEQTKKIAKIQNEILKTKQHLKDAKLAMSATKKELSQGGALKKAFKKFLSEFRDQYNLQNFRLSDYTDAVMNYWYEESAPAIKLMQVEDDICNFDQRLETLQEDLVDKQAEQMDLEKLKCENETMRKLLEKLAKTR